MNTNPSRVADLSKLINVYVYSFISVEFHRKAVEITCHQRNFFINELDIALIEVFEDLELQESRLAITLHSGREIHFSFDDRGKRNSLYSGLAMLKNGEDVSQLGKKETAKKEKDISKYWPNNVEFGTYCGREVAKISAIIIDNGHDFVIVRPVGVSRDFYRLTLSIHDIVLPVDITQYSIDEDVLIVVRLDTAIKIGIVNPDNHRQANDNEKQ